MNKMISFRELIDLEPKPKKVKFDGDVYIFSNGNYVREEKPSMCWSEYNSVKFEEMKEQNIEIIEENIEIIEDKPLIEASNEFTVEGINIECKSGSLFYTVKNMEEKINEIIDFINRKGE